MTITIEAAEHNGVPLRVAVPEGTPRGGVIVLHQAPGYTPQIAEWLQRLAENGYAAVAPLLHHRRGVEQLDPFEFGGIEEFALALPGDDTVAADIAEAADYLRRQGIDTANIGALGFSFGGRAALVAALNGSVAAATSYYANGIIEPGYGDNLGLPALADRLGGLTTPWLGLFGADDFLLAEGELDAIEEALRILDTHAEVIRYPGAGHAFDMEEFMPGAPSPLIPEAAADARTRTLAFFEQHLS
ncbi:dienelactone hydrolase family protein [Microbacterium thalassium]|uniref:Carboxymethylenebutenolidase n=1 Tax=Microbacterium thalassium TaxID=362649 RepID=A0A7X0FMF3_9MICO|nr:dienelactone hydrolase family protein [Microbacterium thalassium]MBB6390192.1 carboxymethylenebutenolidase [Microbacterium thalassium]